MTRKIICMLLALLLCLGLLPVQSMATDMDGDGTDSALTDLSSAVVTINALTYNGGQTIDPAPVVTLSDTVLTLGTDYNVTYTPDQPVNAGNYTVTVTGCGSYTGTVEKTFAVQPGTLTGEPRINTVGAEVELKNLSFTYPSGWPAIVAPVWEVDSSSQVEQGKSYRVTFADPQDNYVPRVMDVIPWPAPSDTTPPALEVQQITYDGSKFTIQIQADEPLSQVKHSVNGAAADFVSHSSRDYAFEISAAQAEAVQTFAVTVSAMDAEENLAEKTVTLHLLPSAATVDYDLTYTGAGLAPVSVSGVDAAAYTVEYTDDQGLCTSAPIHAGAYTYKVTGAAANGYYGTIIGKFSIAKAEYDLVTSVPSLSAKAGDSGSFDLSVYLAETGGTASVGEIEDTHGILEKTEIANGVFTFTIKAAVTGIKTGYVTIDVTSRNYHDYSMRLTVTSAEKRIPVVRADDMVVTYTGKEVTAAGITGTATYNGMEVPGKWNFWDYSQISNVTEVGTYQNIQVCFDPDDQQSYGSPQDIINITIQPATPSGAPTVTKVTSAVPLGEVLVDTSTIVGVDGQPLEGSFQWCDESLDTPADLEAAVEQGKQYYYIFLLPEDTRNYVPCYSGSLVLWEIPKPQASPAPSYEPSDDSSYVSPVVRPVQPEPELGDHAGWEEIKRALTDLADQIASGEVQPGETVTVEMNGVTQVPKAVLAQIAGKDINIEFDMGNGVTWTVNGQDIPAGIGSLDLGVETGGNTIPVNVLNAVTGETSAMQLTLSHNGSFGTTLHLSVRLGKENKGLWANLYYYDQSQKALVFQHASKIKADGDASWPFDHASDYAIVIDDEYHGPAWENPFSDVAESDWFYSAVAYVNRNGLMLGTDDGLFCPDAATTRGMIVTFLYRLEGEPAVKEETSFEDLTERWYVDAVKWAAANGIQEGYSETEYSPDDPITREQLATILWRYAKYIDYDVSAGENTNILSYSDALEISEYAVPAMQWVCSEGILDDIPAGRSGDTLDPAGEVQRSEAAAILHRFCELIEE